MTGPNGTNEAESEIDPALREAINATGVPFWRTLGITLLTAERGLVRLHLPMRAELGTRRPEVMHGGAIATLIDAAAGGCVQTMRTPDDADWGGTSTIDMQVSYLSAATGDVQAEGRILRAGKRIAFVDVTVTDDSGTALAVGRVTVSIARR